MIDNPIKFAVDLFNLALTGFASLTMNELAALLAICWWVYRFADEFYGKWKRSKNKE